MNRILLTSVMAASLALTACSTMEVKTGKDPTADFAKYKSYAWTPAGNAQPQTQTSILDETVRSSVEQQLASKGLFPARDDNPDLVISYSAVSKVGFTYGAAPGPWLWGPTEQVYPTREGSLTLQFVDPKTNRTIWQGTATDVISDAGAGQKQIAEAVQDMLKKYPA